MVSISKFAAAKMLALTLLSLAALAIGLDRAGFNGSEEVRSALAARVMARDGDWVLPLAAGRLHLDRPPMHSWVTAAFSGASGPADESDARLPSALAALALLAVVAWMGGRRAAFFLLAAPVFVHYGRSAELGSLLSLWSGATVVCILRALQTADRGRGPWLFAACMFSGAAFMTGGALASIIPWLPLVCFLPRRPAAASFAWLALGAAAGLAFFLPWFLLVADMEDGTTGIARGVLVGPIRYSGDYYPEMLRRLACVILGMGILAPALPVAIARAWRERADFSSRYLACFAFLAGPILVAAPLGGGGVAMMLAPLAILLARELRPDVAGGPSRRALAALLASALFLGLAYGAAVPSIVALAGSAALAVGFAAVWIAARQGILARPASRYALHGLVVFAIVAQSGWFLEASPRLALYQGTKPFARRIHLRLPQDASLYALGRIDDAFRFYLDETLPELDRAADLPRPPQVPRAFVLAQDGLDALRANPSLGEVFSKDAHWASARPAALFEIFPDRATAPDPPPTSLGPLRIAALGDMGTGDISQYLVADQVDTLDRKAPLDAALFLGDLIYSLDWYKPFDLVMKVELPYRPLLERGLPIRSILGNHDYDNLAVVLNHPPLGLNGENARVLSLRGGLCDIFLADSIALNLKYSTLEQQQSHLKRLGRELSSSRAQWKILAIHNPPYSLAREGDGHEVLRSLVEPLIREHGVDIVLSGDHHVYERIEPGEGEPVYFVMGSSGKLDEEATIRQDPRLKFGAVTHGFLSLEIDPERVKFRAIDKHGVDLDAGFIPHRKGPQPAP